MDIGNDHYTAIATKAIPLDENANNSGTTATDKSAANKRTEQPSSNKNERIEFTYAVLVDNVHSRVYCIFVVYYTYYAGHMNNCRKKTSFAISPGYEAIIIVCKYKYILA